MGPLIENTEELEVMAILGTGAATKILFLYRCWHFQISEVGLVTPKTEAKGRSSRLCLHPSPC